MLKISEKFTINYIDSSSFSKFRRCPVAYMLSRLMGLQKRNRFMIAMDYGTDMHKALPYCYDKNDLQIAISTFNESWKARDHGFDEKRNLSTAEQSLINFTNSHCTSCPYEIVNFDIEAPTHDEISLNELPFFQDIGGPLSIAGRIDAPVRWKADESLFALDYKTTSELSERFLKGFENSPQSIMYTLALALTTGERCRGFIVEGIRVSKVKSESTMHPIFIESWTIENFIQQVNEAAESMLEMNEKQEWQHNFAGCGPYSMFGMPGYICPYTDICTSPDPHAVMRLFERVKPFHPFIME